MALQLISPQVACLVDVSASRPWRERVLDFQGRPATKQTWYTAKVVFKDIFQDLTHRGAPPEEFAALAQAELAFRKAFHETFHTPSNVPWWAWEAW